MLVDDLIQLLHVNDCRAFIAGWYQVNAGLSRSPLTLLACDPGSLQVKIDPSEVSKGRLQQGG